MIAAIVAAVLAVPTVSYAAAPDAVGSAVRKVADLIPGVNNDGAHGDNDDGDAPTPPAGDEPAADDQGPWEPAGTAVTVAETEGTPESGEDGQVGDGSDPAGDTNATTPDREAGDGSETGLGDDGPASSPPDGGEPGSSQSDPTGDDP